MFGIHRFLVTKNGVNLLIDGKFLSKLFGLFFANEFLLGQKGECGYFLVYLDIVWWTNVFLPPLFGSLLKSPNFPRLITFDPSLPMTKDDLRFYRYGLLKC